MKKVVQLTSLRGVGVQISWKFVQEFSGWRKFKNRKEPASLAGLSPTPYDSGGSQREQGISKAGNKRIRTLAVEMSWVWLRFQPQSKLSQWYLDLVKTFWLVKVPVVLLGTLKQFYFRP